MFEDRYYTEYLWSKLDLIFNGNGQTFRTNSFYHPKSTPKNLNPDYRDKTGLYSYGQGLMTSKAYEMFPEIANYSKSINTGLILDNGIVGVAEIKGINPKDEYYFPQLNAVIQCHPSTIRTFSNGTFSIGEYLFDKDRRVINVNPGMNNISYKPLSQDFVLVVYENLKNKTYNLVGRDCKLLSHKNFTNVIEREHVILLQVNETKEKNPDPSKNEGIYVALLDNDIFKSSLLLLLF